LEQPVGQVLLARQPQALSQLVSPEPQAQVV